MEFLAIPSLHDWHNPYGSMEATGPQRNSPSPAQGVPQSLFSSALDEGTLTEGAFREKLRDEAIYPNIELEQEYISTDTLDPDEGILDPSYSRGYGDGPCCGEGNHHHSLEGPPSCKISPNGAVEPTPAPAFQGMRVSQGASPPQTVYPPMTQQPGDPNDILRLLKRSGGGRAKCLWMHGGLRCDYTSHIDLVKRHIKRVHFRLRPCVCEYCGRRFFNNYALSLHRNSHTGAKPFVCNFCGRGFSSPSGKSHHRVHMHGYRVPRRSIVSVDGFIMVTQ